MGKESRRSFLHRLGKGSVIVAAAGTGGLAGAVIGDTVAKVQIRSEKAQADATSAQQTSPVQQEDKILRARNTGGGVGGALGGYVAAELLSRNTKKRETDIG